MSGGIETARANQRAQRRAEVYEKRVEAYRNNLAGEPLIRDWGIAVASQERRARHTRAFSRLDNQLQKHAQTLPDQSGVLRALEANVAILTWADDVIGLDDLSGTYAESIGEYRRVRNQERKRTDPLRKAENLRREVQLTPNKTVHLNPESHQAIIEDRVVTFKNPTDWEVFQHFARFRNAKIKPKEIREAAGVGDDSPTNITYQLVQKQREIIGDDTKNPRIITTNSHGRGTFYCFAPEEARFHYPSQSMQPEKGVATNGREEIVDLNRFRQKREESRKKEQLEAHFANRKNPFDVRGEVRKILDSYESTGITFPLKGYKLFSGYFKRLEPKFQARMLARSGALRPDKSDDHHPNYTDVDVAVMLFTKTADEYLQGSDWDALRAIITEELEARIALKEAQHANKTR